MPFGTIAVNSKNFEPRGVGRYVLSTVAFGDPSNEFRVKGAAKGKDSLYRGSVARVLEKDVTVGSETTRKVASVALSLTIPSSGFTAAEIDAMASDISEFLTAATITRLLSEES